MPKYKDLGLVRGLQKFSKEEMISDLINYEEKDMLRKEIIEDYKVLILELKEIISGLKNAN